MWYSLKTRDSRDGTIQCPVFSDTQPERDCPVFSTRKHGTAGTGQSNVPYFQTYNRDGTLDCPVPAFTCFIVENTGQPGRNNPMSYFQTHSRDGTVPCFLVENTGQPGRDNQMPVFSDTQPGRDCRDEKPRDNPMSRIFRHTAGTGLSRVFSLKTRDSRDGTIKCPYFQTHSRDGTVGTRKHGTIQCPVFSDTQPGNTGQPVRDGTFFLVPSRRIRVVSVESG